MTQLLPLFLIGLAGWFLFRSLRKRLEISKSTAENNNQRTSGLVKFLAIALLGAWIFQFYLDWSAERDERSRRNNLTQEQRAHEDAVAAEKQALQNKIDAKKAKEAPFIEACRSALLNSLNDPISANISYTVGWFDDAGLYTGSFEGRAKNLYGTYVLGGWYCTATGTGSSVVVLGVRQYKP